MKLIHPLTKILTECTIKKSKEEYISITFEDGLIVKDDYWILDILLFSEQISLETYNKKIQYDYA